MSKFDVLLANAMAKVNNICEKNNRYHIVAKYQLRKKLKEQKKKKYTCNCSTLQTQNPANGVKKEKIKTANGVKNRVTCVVTFSSSR